MQVDIVQKGDIISIENAPWKARAGITDIDEFKRTSLNNLLDGKPLIQYSGNETIDGIIKSFIVFYLTSDKKPQDGEITNINVDSNITLDFDVLSWIEDMYDYFGVGFPNLKANIKNFEKINFSSKEKTAITLLSGGKDSVYVTLDLNSKGYEVHPLHVAKMNTATQIRELKAILNLDGLFIDNIQSTKIVPFQNIWNNIHGLERYQVRDALLFALALPLAYKNNIAEIHSGSYANEDKKWYSSKPSAVNSLEGLFASKGMSVKLGLIEDLNQSELVITLLDKYPGYFEHTIPCINSRLIARQKRNWFLEKYDFPLPEGLCGVCPKDIEIVLSLLKYKMQDRINGDFSKRLQLVPNDTAKDIIKYYVSRYHNYANVKEFVALDNIIEVARLYGVKFRGENII